MNYYHVDVFSKGPLTGNGLAVFVCEEFPAADRMLAIAREMKQFETVFLCERSARQAEVRIFTVEEELPFAGHPILGAAAVLYERAGMTGTATIQICVSGREITVNCAKRSDGFTCIMNQGPAEFGGPIDKKKALKLVKPLGIAEHLAADLPLEVVSTGLPYLIVPIRGGIENAGIRVDDYEARLQKVGAKFVYVFDVETREGRTWNNRGMVEDVATGSAAGPAGAYLCRYGLADDGEEIVLHQGRFCGRESELHVMQSYRNLFVSGRVNIVIRGESQRISGNGEWNT